MRYEDRWTNRGEPRDRSRQEAYGQSDDFDGRRGREDRHFGRQDHDHDHHRHEHHDHGHDHDHDEHRAWRPFGETGPTRYGSGDDGDTADYYGRGGRYRRETRDEGRGSYGGERPERGSSQYGPAYGGRGYGGGYGSEGARDGGFGETGGRYSASYDRHEQYGRRDQWGSNPRSGYGNDGRSWFDKASDKVQSWFGDDDARRRQQWDEVRTGEHRGRGPKGYRRSDERIRDDVSDRLSDDSWVDASDIEVRVEQGEVTLTGFVSRREDKRRAEDLAESVSGVDNVQNQLRVRREGQSYSQSQGQTQSHGMTGADRTSEATSGPIGTTGTATTGHA